jgi:hypothetical protein
VAYFNVLFWHLPGVTKETLIRDNRSPGRDLRPRPLEKKVGALTARSRHYVSHSNKEQEKT